MSKIYVTSPIPQAGIDLLRAAFDTVDINPTHRPLSQAELKEKVKDSDVLLCLLTDKIDADVMAAAPHLKGVVNFAVGFNNIDLAYAREHGITVTNTPGVLTDTTADLAWALLMCAARRILEADRMMREGRFAGWETMLMLGVDIHHKTLGIVGMGRIGQAVARRATGFDMKIQYFNHGKMVEGLPFDSEAVTLETLLKTSDFISLHLPYTPDTHHLLTQRELDMMKPTAVLINTARGQIVDEAALVQALKTGRIYAAGLDVFEHEPAMAEGLAELTNVVLAPHIGSASIETRTNMSVLCARNAVAILRGEKPITPVQ